MPDRSMIDDLLERDGTAGGITRNCGCGGESSPVHVSAH